MATSGDLSLATDFYQRCASGNSLRAATRAFVALLVRIRALAVGLVAYVRTVKRSSGATAVQVPVNNVLSPYIDIFRSSWLSHVKTLDGISVR